MGKNILVIGVGGTGSTAVDLMFQKQRELGNQAGNTVRAIVLDTDAGDIGRITAATVLSMTDDCTLGDVVDKFNPKALEDWFPCYQREAAAKLGKEDGTNYRTLDMSTGANQWRKKSFLAFLNMMKREGYKFDNALNEMVSIHRASTDSGTVEVYVVASLAGGTGSGSFLPIAFYVKKFFQKAGITPKVRAILACPDIYADELTSPMQDNESSMQKTKIYANAYAIFRELNAITEVAYGHNDPTVDVNAKGKTKIRFKLGHQDLPTRVLYDAEDRYYWDTSALPFNRIYLLDKIPGIKSIPAHNGILANTLYNLVCTEVALAFDTVENNDDPDLINEEKHNANYSAVSSAELRYPLDSIMDYIAYRKAEQSAEGEWLTVYRETEKSIAILRERAEQRGLPFEPSSSQYAEEVFKVINGILNVQKTSMSTRVNPLIPILERGLYDITVVDGTKERNLRTGDYIAKLEKAIEKELYCPIIARLDAASDKGDPTILKKPGFGKAAKTEAKKSFATLVQDADRLLQSYYKNAVITIRDNARQYVNGIFPVDGDYNANEGFSLVYNLLMRDGSYIHPVSAFAQLCDLRREIDKKLANFKPWSDLESLDAVGKLPEKFYTCDFNHDDMEFTYDDSGDDADSEAKKKTYKARVSASVYMQMGKTRFGSFVKDMPKAYLDGNTDVTADSIYLAADIGKLHDKLAKEAKKQFLGYVLSFISSRVDTMITQYRRFFEDFEEQKKRHSQNVESVLRSNEGKQDVLYIAASAEAKMDAYEKYLKKEGKAVSQKQIDDAAGKSVVDIAYAACCAAEEKDNKKKTTKVDSSAVFTALINGFREMGKESDYYKEQAEKGIFEILVDEVKRQNPGLAGKELLPFISATFAAMYKSAEPSLKVNGGLPYAFLLLPQKSAEYLREKANDFNLSTVGFVSAAALERMNPIDREKCARSELSSLADQFIKNCGIQELKIRLAQNIPNTVVYLTRKINQITPLMLDKVNETAREPVYFTSYMTAINKKYGESSINDTWNPHLGMELHKHGYLPYINPEYEKFYDQKIAKALLYMILEGKISYRTASRDNSTRVFYYVNRNGQSQPIRQGRSYVNEDNLHSLMNWLRMDDRLVEEYSTEYDALVKRELSGLPIVTNPAQIGTLMGRITKNKLIVKLRTNLFADVSGVTEKDKRLNVGLLGFAYNLKATEEADHDSGDAEKILAVGYDTVREFCEHRIPNANRTGLISAHLWQLKKFVWAYADGLVGTEERISEQQTVEVFAWANENKCFLLIDQDSHDTPDETWDDAPVKKILDQKRAGGEPESFDDDSEA